MACGAWFLSHSIALPRAVLRKPKWRFGVHWAQHPRRVPQLRDLVASLPSSPLTSDGPFNRAAMDRMLTGFLAGRPNGDVLVRQLLMIHLWYQACVANPVSGRPHHGGST
jgi:hypothetical protein